MDKHENCRILVDIYDVMLFASVSYVTRILLVIDCLYLLGFLFGLLI